MENHQNHYNYREGRTTGRDPVSIERRVLILQVLIAMGAYKLVDFRCAALTDHVFRVI